MFEPSPNNEWGSSLSQQISYHDDLLGNANAQYIETQIADGSTYRKDYFDGLGRTYKTVTKAFTHDSTDYDQYVDTVYDALGRLWKKSNPYINGCESTKYYTVYGYDDAGRVKNKTYPDGTCDTIGYSYSGNQRIITVTDAKGASHVSRYDSRGRLVYRSDSGNGVSANITYQYDALGRLTRTTDSAGNITIISYDSLGRKIYMKDPNTGESYYTYYDNGQLKEHNQKISSSNYITLTYTYDVINRPVSEISSDGTVAVHYFYDNQNGESVTNGTGMLTSVIDNAGKTVFSYDKRGNPMVMTKSFDENGDGTYDSQYAVESEFDALNRKISLTYPDGTETEQHYATAGYLEAVTIGGDALVKYGRQEGAASLCDGNFIKRYTGNGVETTIEYNPANLRPVSVVTSKDGVDLEDVSYTYDNVGNIEYLTDNLDSQYTEHYTYDGLNRLTNAKGVYNPTEGLNYNYDAQGNLITKDSLTMTYGDSSHPHAATGYNGKTYSYDSRGNMIDRNGQELVYDAKNRLIAYKEAGIVKEEYFYDYSGFRTRIKRSADNVNIYNIAGIYEVVKIPDTDDAISKYVYGMNGDLVAKLTSDGGSSAGFYNITKDMYNWKDLNGLFLKLHAYANAIFADPENQRYIIMGLLILALLCSVWIFIYNEFFRQEPLMIQRWLVRTVPLLVFTVFASFSFTGCFDWWATDFENAQYFHPNHIGSVKMMTDKDGNVIANYHYKPYGELVPEHSTGMDMSKYKYTGQQADDSSSVATGMSGLYYYNARYYDAEVGRFTSADTVVPNPLNTQAFNRYMYVNGNPINFGDPSGHFSFKKLCNKVGDAIADGLDTVFSGIGNGINNLNDGINNTLANKDWWKDQGDKIEKKWDKVADKCGDTIGDDGWWGEQWDSWGMIATCAIIAAVIIIASFGVGAIAFAGAGLVMGWWSVAGCAIGFLIGGTQGQILHKPFSKETWENWNWKYAALGAAIGAAVGAASQMSWITSTSKMQYLHYWLKLPNWFVTGMIEAGFNTGSVILCTQALQSGYNWELSFTFGYYQNDNESYCYVQFFGAKKKFLEGGNQNEDS